MMKKTIIAALAVLLFSSMSYAEVNKAIVINIDGAIGPATTDHTSRGIAHAAKTGAGLIVIRMDTPGGLDKSMRSIIKDVLASDVPIVTYVAPSGARAASAGTFMIYASHISAMAPGTNLGAASPVSIGGGGGLPTPGAEDKSKETEKAKEAISSNSETLGKKVKKDATAYIRSLAQLRGRNIEFAEMAVKEADTLTATEALDKKVIEFVAKDLTDLLEQINGYKVTIAGVERLINTENIILETFEPDWRTKFLSVITDPSVAYVLLLIGVYGLFFEFANPGFVVPGVAGAIAIILAMYAFQLLPISYAGLSLIFLGIMFMVAEAFVPSFGALGFGGVIAFVAGSILLLDTNVAGFNIAWQLIAIMAVLNASFFFLMIQIAIRSRRKKVVSGREALLGSLGVMLEDSNGSGYARIGAERWQIKTSTALKKGDIVKVKEVHGILLHVEPKE